MTASRAERLRSCHFAYFMEYGLRAKPRRAAAFDAPPDRPFLHYLLENVTRDVWPWAALPPWRRRPFTP
jgi:ATP-dependent helicase/nuclease subunit B